MSNAKPTHELKVRDDETGDWAKVGVGWISPEGWVTLKLSPCSVLSYETMKNKSLTLFPIKTDKEWAAFHAKKRQEQQASKSAAEQGDGKS
jgi:hypothetical protein